jgi:hypothetical protein
MCYTSGQGNCRKFAVVRLQGSSQLNSRSWNEREKNDAEAKEGVKSAKTEALQTSTKTINIIAMNPSRETKIRW